MGAHIGAANIVAPARLGILWREVEADVEGILPAGITARPRRDRNL
jgi:hypothetical protein